ncbi:cell division protein FtsQ/DivIB [Candidatus Pelagibacter sp.]|uniref:cell division protein FtsQ/DivIB n=1 Tax=Candidatus Pelagibacter sp. TaxID=2024849 RepID=UPI003F826FB9
MHQLISKKVIIYLCLFFLLVTVNNNSIINLRLPIIERIKISGFDLDQSNQVKNVIESLKSKNIFFINQFEIKKNIFSDNVIEELSIFKNYPSTLIVNIKKTQFLAVTKKDGEDFFIGKNGKLIKKNKSIAKLPYVYGDLNTSEFLKFKKNIDDSNFEFKQILNLYYYKSKRWDIETSNGYLIKLPRENISEVLNLFIRLSKEKNFNDKKTIDFRQKGQIILDAK